MDCYFPKQYVKQSDLGIIYLLKKIYLNFYINKEQYDGVSKGKYTIGLEQENMAFVNDREDIYSMSLTGIRYF